MARMMLKCFLGLVKGYVMANADSRLKEACPELEEIGFNKDEAVAKHLADILVLNRCSSQFF